MPRLSIEYGQNQIEFSGKVQGLEMKDTDTDILSSEAGGFSNFPGTKSGPNRGLPGRSPCLVLHLSRPPSHCHLPPSGSGLGLVGNDLGCNHQGLRSNLHPSAPSRGGASSETGGLWVGAAGRGCRGGQGAAFTFAGCALCPFGRARSWTCLPVLCPRWGESTLS